MEEVLNKLLIQKVLTRMTFSSPKAKEIFCEYLQGNCSYAELAREYNLSNTWVRQIIIKHTKRFINVYTELEEE